MLRRRIIQFFKSEDGPTAVEYAVMLALITGAVLASVGTLATATKDSFDYSGNAINAVLSGN
jgi:pilus assembly protein Flp/PilA